MKDRLIKNKTDNTYLVFNNNTFSWVENKNNATVFTKQLWFDVQEKISEELDARNLTIEIIE